VPSETLRTAFLHLAPRSGEPDANRASLAEAVTAAGRSGARLVLAPELAISGYCFRNRDEAASLAEPAAGPTLQALAPLCREYGLYVAVGILERDAGTGLLHNSALLVGPGGCALGLHRKLLAERAWATPGLARQAGSLVMTPWGQIALQVCADSYVALPARAQALRGADLLVVLANWPPAGVDPRRVWRARALENGFGVLACNRTGLDRGFDCREARSYAVSASGETLLDAACPDPRSFLVDLPLACGRFPRNSHALEGRQPDQWRALGLDVNGLGDTAFLWGGTPDLPVPLELHAGPGPFRPNPKSSGLRVAALAAGETSRGALDHLRGRGWPEGLILAGADDAGPFLGTGTGLQRPGASGVLLAVHRNLRIAVARPEALRHPEPAVVLAKDGCDLLVLPAAEVEADLEPVLATRCLERVPVLLVAPLEMVLFLPPEGHGPWGEIRRRGPGPLEVRLDAAAYRRRYIFDRLDLEGLLG
jgi:predicted amidohydrolase